MKDVIIRLNLAEAQILRNDLYGMIQVKEALKESALKRMQDETLDEMERDIARESNEMLSCQIGLYRDICGRILKSLLDTKL